MACLFENGCVIFHCHLPAQSQSNDSYSHNKEPCLSVGTKRDQDCLGFFFYYKKYEWTELLDCIWQYRYNKIHQYKNLIVKLDRERGKYEEIKKDVISNDGV